MANESFLKQTDSKRYTNEEVRQMTSDLADAERRIGAAARKAGIRWEWAPYSKPSTGGPYLWNDIIVTYPGGGKRCCQALEFCEEMEQE